jgi:pyrimidine-nucleoside phosphorylase
MRAVDIIAKKRDGEPLDENEIRWFIRAYTDGTIPDYQASALLMAIYWRGMDDHETAILTDAMAQSGDTLDLSAFGKTVDKHSSGGVGDKTTLVVGPIVASTGLPVAKMSGRGLGFTGGTLDKLESIPGWTSKLSHDEFMEQVKAIGLVIAGATTSLAPADGKLYALRDVTATVSSLPLIAASIMSKKLAAGANAILLDVKVGEGAFMPTVPEATTLAETMVAIGERMGRNVTALISDMNQPLGRTIGNALEVKEAIETLHGKGPTDFTEHCLTCAAHMFLLGDKAATFEEGYSLAKSQLESGAAWEKFVQAIAHQKGDIASIENPDRLPVAPVKETLTAPQDGYLAHLNAREVGLTVVELGGGRAKKEDTIDPSVGVVLHAKVGDKLAQGDPILEVHARNQEECAAALERLAQVCTFSDEAVEAPPLFYATIGG